MRSPYSIRPQKRATPPPLARSSTIPGLHAANALAVTDGTTTVGFIVEHDGSHFAYDADGILIGEYQNRIEAMSAIPAGSAS